MTKIQKVYPGVPILSSIGNNDVEYHYQAPNTTDKAQYYSDMFDLWFTNVSANMAYKNISYINETFLNGGYYRYDTEEDISLISLNSILVNSENNNDLETGGIML